MDAEETFSVILNKEYVTLSCTITLSSGRGGGGGGEEILLVTEFMLQKPNSMYLY